MSDAVLLAVIGVASSAVTTIGVGIVAYFQYGARKTADSTERKVDQVHELTNSRLSRIEAALAMMTHERNQLLGQVARQESAKTEAATATTETIRRVADGVARPPTPEPPA